MNTSVTITSRQAKLFINLLEREIAQMKIINKEFDLVEQITDMEKVLAEVRQAYSHAGM